MECQEYIFKVEGGPIAADVYYNTSNVGQKHPLALYFHGGNFTVGSKELLSKSFAENLVDLGFVIVAPNYRLCPTISLYNGPVADTFDAYNWALRHLPAILKRDAGIDVDDKKVVTFGHSCGGTLALLTASLPRPPLAILDIYGMKYLRDPFYNSPSSIFANRPQFDEDFINQIYKDVPPPSRAPPPMGPNGPDFSNYRIAWMFAAIKEGKHMSRVIQDGDFDRVDPASLFSKEHFPPTYFIHGTSDTLVDAKFSQRAYEDLKANNVETEIVLVEGAGHGFDAIAQSGSENFAIISKGFQFLKAHVV